MNITNAAYFTFNVDNTMFLTGQTGSGKSVLQDKLIDSLVKAKRPSDLQFVLLDMTAVDFTDLREKHSNYILKYTAVNPDEGLDTLDEMAELSNERASGSISNPLIFICIEECDMAVTDQDRFDNAVMQINRNAHKANMKLIYSTSRPGADAVSKQLLDSFDLIVAGQLASDKDYDYLGVPKASNNEPYSFTIVDNNQNDK